MKTKYCMTTTQAFVIVANSILGAGILTLPRELAERMKTPDGWITVIVGALLSFALGMLIVKLGQRFPGKTFFEYSQLIAGKWVGRLLNLCLVIYTTVLSGYEIRNMTEVTKYLLLEKTPREIIMIIFMCVGVYLITGGMRLITGFFELILPITVVILVISILLSFKIFEVDNLRPVIGMGIVPLLKGVPASLLSFLGFEVMFIVTAFMAKPETAGKVIMFGIGLPTVFYVFTVLTVIGGMSVEQVSTLTWPTISITRSYEYTGVLLERYESLVIVVWIIQMFSTYAINHYIASLGLSNLFQRDQQRFIYALLPIIFIFAMQPKNINSINMLGEMLGYLIYSFLILIMPILFFIALRKRGIQ